MTVHPENRKAIADTADTEGIADTPQTLQPANREGNPKWTCQCARALWCVQPPFSNDLNVQSCRQG